MLDDSGGKEDLPGHDNSGTDVGDDVLSEKRVMSVSDGSVNYVNVTGSNSPDFIVSLEAGADPTL